MACPPFDLRPPHADDILPYTAFLADPEVSRWLDDSAQRPIPASRVESLLLHEAWSLWSIDCGGRFVGVTSFYEPDLSLSTARLSIVIGDREIHGKGLATAVIGRVVGHGFRQLGLHKINSDILAPNTGALTAHERNGFVREGCLRDDCWREGRWVDRVLLSLLRREYQAPDGGA